MIWEYNVGLLIRGELSDKATVTAIQALQIDSATDQIDRYRETKQTQLDRQNNTEEDKV